MSLVLTLLALVLLLRLVHARCNDLRTAFMTSSIAWGILVVALTEALSALHFLNVVPLASCWAIIDIVLLTLVLQCVRTGRQQPLLSATPVRFERMSAMVMTFLVLLVVALGITALIGAPNNYDAMTYHMARVAHWIQNGDVRFYPTHIERQNHMTPFAEFCILHFQLLSGSDRFANSVQFLAYVGTLIGVSKLASQLGAGGRGQVFAAALAATMPMAILQASSTQNDLVASYWLVCLASGILELRKNPSIAVALLAGASLGLAILTKATAYVYCLPFVAWAAIILVQRRRAQALPILVAFGFVSVLLNLGHYTRNHGLYGSVLGPADEARFYKNDVRGPASLLSNAIRNVALELGTPVQPVNAAIGQGVRSIHKLLGIDPDDPRTTWIGSKFIVPKGVTSEDVAGNALATVLLLLSVASLLILRPPVGQAAYLFTAVLFCSFAAFCWYLKWQPFHSRLLLPLVVLGSVVTGLVIERTCPRMLQYGIAGLTFALAIPSVTLSWNHPWFGRNSIFTQSRQDQYFQAAGPDFRDCYRHFANLVSASADAKVVGFVCRGNDPEYPLWALLRYARPSIQLEQVQVTGPSRDARHAAAYDLPSPHPTLTATFEDGRVRSKVTP